ncbi:MAG: tetratricopeptide repeat protein [Candidatus Omnitrophica bacterium]|nr:tetratricopeptide repeat protein [Candidatus Omnitrophota bacterium]
MSGPSELKMEYEKAVDLYGHGKPDEAIAVLKSVLEKDPEFYDAYEALGMICYKSGRFDDAIAWTQRLAEKRPDYAMAHTNLSIFYMKKGMKEKAEEEKAKAVVLNFSKTQKDRA